MMCTAKNVEADVAREVKGSAQEPGTLRKAVTQKNVLRREAAERVERTYPTQELEHGREPPTVETKRSGSGSMHLDLSMTRATKEARSEMKQDGNDGHQPSKARQPASNNEDMLKAALHAAAKVL